MLGCRDINGRKILRYEAISLIFQVESCSEVLFSGGHRKIPIILMTFVQRTRGVVEHRVETKLMCRDSKSEPNGSKIYTFVKTADLFQKSEEEKPRTILLSSHGQKLFPETETNVFVLPFHFYIVYIESW